MSITRVDGGALARVPVAPHQRAFLDLQTRVAGLFGGIGCGKTWCGALWWILKAVSNPGSLGVVASSTHRQLREATLKTLFELARELGVPFVYGSAPPGEWEVQSAFPGHSGIITWYNGAQDMTWSTESGERLRGPEVSRAWVDELRECSRPTWDVILGRFRGRCHDGRPQLRVTSSPNGFDWMYRYFVEEPQENLDLAEARQFVQGRTADNWALPHEYVPMLRASYDEAQQQQELEGQFVDLGMGRCYHGFARDDHVTDAEPAWAARVDYWSLTCDFNVDPMAWLLCKQNKATREVYVRHELWMRDTNTEAAARSINEMLPHLPGGTNPVHIYGDATGKARKTAGTSDYALLQQALNPHLMRVPSSNPRVKDRVAAVNWRLNDRTGEGRPKLLVHPECR